MAAPWQGLLVRSGVQVLVARSKHRGDYLAKFRCDDDLIQNYWFSLFNDRLYVSQTNTEP